MMYAMINKNKVMIMDEYIEKDYHYSTRYALIKNGERIEFNSEQDACEFLGVKKCSVVSCFNLEKLDIQSANGLK